jgi:hypothetical protein
LEKEVELREEKIKSESPKTLSKTIKVRKIMPEKKEEDLNLLKE